MASQQAKTSNKISTEEQQQHQTHNSTSISPQETEPYRAQAQQNSINAINAAEERYIKAKESGTSAFQQTKEAVVHGLGAGTNYLTGKGYQAAEYTAEKGKQGYELAKETALTAAQKTAEVAKQAAVKAKEAAVSSGETVMDYAKGGTGEVKESALVQETEEEKERMREVLIGEEEKEEGRGGRAVKSGI